MSRFRGLFARVRDVVRRKGAESRMEEEFAFHLDMEVGKLIDAGVPAREARRRALLTFGGLEGHRETMRDERGARWFADAGTDIRYALQSMRRSPGFALAVALTLGLGIGMNGAVFGYVNSLLFRPMPVREPDQLVGLFDRDGRSGDVRNIWYQDFLAFRDRSGAFASLAGVTALPINLTTTAGSGDMVWGEMVTEDFFSVLDMRPANGRFFGAVDAPQGANAFVVLSYESWRRRFHADPAIQGKTVRLNGRDFTITGVAPKGFRGIRLLGFWPEMWVPIGMHDVLLPGSTGMLTRRAGSSLWLVGRMKPGFDRIRTQAVADVFAHQLALAAPATNADMTALVVPARSGFENPAFLKPTVLTLSSALGLFASLVVLLIICANLANLQLARTTARSTEFAIRLSLGCSRSRLARQLTIEAAMLALPGLVIAAIVLQLGIMVEPYLTPKLQFQVGMDASIDVRVTVFTAAVALIAVALFGLVPAARVGRANLVPSGAGVLGASTSLRGRKPARLRGALVVSQLALSVVLLIGGSLFARSLMAARTIDLGFDPTNRVMLSMNVGLQGYDSARGQRFYDEVLSRVRALPFVQHASLVFPAPFDTEGRGVRFYSPGLAGTRDGTIGVDTSVVSDGVVSAMGLRLEAGRDLAQTDTAATPLVMLVSRSLASRFWNGQDPLGQRARLGGADGPEVTVVGVVSDAQFAIVAPTGLARAYFPVKQRYRDWETVVVHVRDDPTRVMPTLRDTITGIDFALPVFGVTTLPDAVSSGLATSRIAATISMFFGVFALLIASIGLYAVVRGSVAERTREVGVRMALGATPRAVVGLLMRSGTRMGAIGLAIGLAAAFAMSRAMASLLYGISPNDPATFIVVPLALVVIVLAATWLPARRAARLYPVAALRKD